MFATGLFWAWNLKIWSHGNVSCCFSSLSELRPGQTVLCSALSAIPGTNYRRTFLTNRTCDQFLVSNLSSLNANNMLWRRKSRVIFPKAGKFLCQTVIFRWYFWYGCSFKHKTALEEASALRGNVFSSSETRLCLHYIYWYLHEIISCLTWPSAWLIHGCKLKQIDPEEFVGPFPHGAFGKVLLALRRERRKAAKHMLRHSCNV